MTSLIGHACLDTADGRRAGAVGDGAWRWHRRATAAAATAAAWLPLLRHQGYTRAPPPVRPTVIADSRLCLSSWVTRTKRRTTAS